MSFLKQCHLGKHPARINSTHLNVTLSIKLVKHTPLMLTFYCFTDFQFLERTFISTFQPLPTELGQKSIICYTKTMERFLN